MLLKMVVFDLDGVLVDVDSSWQLIHRAFSTNNEENFQRYLRGEIDYNEFVRSDIRLWGRANIDQIRSILEKVPMIATARDVITELKTMGYKTAIISSGISVLADHIKKKLNIDRSYANKLIVDADGWLTGEGEGEVQLLGKDVVLRRLTDEEGVETKQCAVIGDSRFDIPLFKEAGLSIAFNAKDDLVKTAADIVIDGKDLRKILPWLSSRQLKKAEASLRCGSRKVARAIAISVSPDNLKVPPEMRVRTWSEGKIVNIRVICTMTVKTLLATLDDLLTCIGVAEKIIQVIEPF
jgi:phosphoserine phosphatase